MSGELDLVVVEDSEIDYELILARLATAGLEARGRRVETADELREALRAGRVDVVLSDHHLPGFDSLGALAIVREHDPDLPFLIVSGAIGEELAVAAMRAGANDYLLKDRLARLAPAVTAAIEAAGARRARRAAEAALVESEARFRALTSNLPGTVFQLRLASDDVILDYVSDRASALLGPGAGDMRGRPQPLERFLDSDDVPRLREMLQAAGAHEDAALHWQGRLRPAEGAAPVWVQVDAVARPLADGSLQWNGIVRDVSRRQRAEEELRASREEARALASHLNRIREEEREYLAREIHDDVGSSLTAVKFGLSSLRNAAGLPPELAKRTRDIERIVEGVVETTSRIVHDLRPGIVDEGIVPALEWLVRTFEQRVGVPCRFYASPQDIELDRESSIAVFRVCQEALNNAAKYAKASRIDVRLELAGGSLALEVRDNGRGIAAADLARSPGWGLRGMRERAASLGGALDISASPGGGATITLLLPQDGEDETLSPETHA